MAKVRNPKPEIRKKFEGRSPKGQVQRLPPQLRLVALTRARISEADGLGFRISCFFQISGFGLRISLMPHFTENSEEPAEINESVAA
jgi:hypothetical protein